MGRKKNKKVSGSTPEVIYGRDLLTVGAGAPGLTQVILVPATFDRALAIADSFAFYRFKNVKIIVSPNVSASSVDYSASMAMGFLPGVAPDTPPASQDNVMNLSRAKFHGFGKTVDTILNLRPKDLIMDAQLPWFKTIAGTPDSQFEQQGIVYFYWFNRGAGTPPGFSVVVEYIIEFQGLVPTTSTPLRRILTQSAKTGGEIIDVGGSRYLHLNQEILRALRLGN